MTVRYHDGHFIYLTRFGECAARFGATANWEHYFKGSHDVATGMCALFLFELYNMHSGFCLIDVTSYMHSINTSLCIKFKPITYAPTFPTHVMHLTCFYVYRELVNLVDAASSFAASVNKLTGGDNGRPCILGLTVSRQTKDLTNDEVLRLVTLYNRLHDARVITDGAAATERGDKKGHLHVQACFWLPRLNRNAAEVQAACTELVYEHAQFAGTRRHVFAAVHEPGTEPHVTWRTQAGCDYPFNANWISLNQFTLILLQR
jgi:hypothetical protein